MNEQRWILPSFTQTFFDEADELLADMEQHLLLLSIRKIRVIGREAKLNAIFRSAHPCKEEPQHLASLNFSRPLMCWKNLLDSARRHEMVLCTDDIINLFLEAKDIGATAIGCT